MQLTQVLNAQNKVHIKRESVLQLKLLGAGPWGHGSKPAVSLIFDPEVRQELIEPLTPDMADGNNLLALTAATPLEEKPCSVTGKEPPPRTHVIPVDVFGYQWVEKNGCSGVHVVVVKEVMWLNVWYIQVESKYKEMRNATLETRGRESAKKKGGGGGQAGQHKLSSLGQGPTMSPGRSETCRYIAAGLLRSGVTFGHHAPTWFWTVGAKASVACSMPASVYSRVARKRKISTLSLRSAVENGSFPKAIHTNRHSLWSAFRL